MSPSRGFNCLLRARINIAQYQHQHHVRRFSHSHFEAAATDPSNKTQVYISRSLDPYLNLSIEHYLLQNTPENSTVLFLYTNRPSIVIGRNQNPWTEVNLRLLREKYPEVQLVRRRSGGGTVFHDEGNVNYSVICPSPAFDRDKHANMVVRALHKLGVTTARVNERHDIALRRMIPNPKAGFPPYKFFKISGSAYKLTRKRSLHHGTCLLWSQNLNAIRHLLKSPTKVFAHAVKGVESVSSKITNAGGNSEAFENAVVSEFSSMYEATQPRIVTEALKDIPKIAQGLEELKSEDWIYSQTPQFTFHTTDFAEIHPSRKKTGQHSWYPLDLEGDADADADAEFAWSFTAKQARTALEDAHAHFNMSFTARHGHITDLSIAFPGSLRSFEIDAITDYLVGKKIHEIQDWKDALFLSLKEEEPDPAFYLERQLLPFHVGEALNDLLLVPRISSGKKEDRSFQPWKRPIDQSF